MIMSKEVEKSVFQHDNIIFNSLTARDAFLRHFIKVPERPGTHLCIFNVFNAKQA